MPANLQFEFEFTYGRLPRIPVVALAPSGMRHVFYALIDTGADITILDQRIAIRLGIQTEADTEVRIAGIGSSAVTGQIGLLDLVPLGEHALHLSLNVAFVPNIGEQTGNLLGRDILEQLDFAIIHSTRTGYLGRTETPA